MIFYVSGNYRGDVDFMEWLVRRRSAILTSFAYPAMLAERTSVSAPFLREARAKIPHMLDSGAFTVWNSGGTVDIEAYADTCNRMVDEYGDVFDWTFVSLDVIAGDKGRAATAQELADAAVVMAKNYDFLLARVRGVVKPVIHVGDPPWLLDHFRSSPVLGVGMRLDLPEEQRTAFAASIERKAPGAKLHGLAATGHAMMRACNWHSVDSAAWQYAASMGSINLTRPNGALVSVPISVESPAKHDLNKHVTTLPPPILRLVEERAAQRGTTIEKLATIYQERWKWNVMEYEAAAQAAVIDRRKAPRPYQEGLFS